MQSREPSYRQKFRNSMRLNNGGLENGKLVKGDPDDYDIPDMPSRAEREMRMKQIEKLAREKNPDPSNLIHLLREKECEIHALSEALENSASKRRELQEALAEAQTIIEQQQDQLSEFRRQAAQCRTDAEAFKMKNMFLSLGANDRDQEMNALMQGCDRLEAEVEALTWQLSQNRHTLTQVENQRDHLKRQLDEAVQWRETLVADQTTAALAEANTETTAAKANSSSPVLNGDLLQKFAQQQKSEAPPSPEQPRSSRPTTQVIHIQSDQHTAELDNLRQQLSDLREREREWVRTRSQLLDEQQLLREEREKHLSRIEMLVQLQAKSPSVPDSELNTDQQSGSRISQQLDPAHLIEIRRLTDERSRWRQYACNLVRMIVDHCEEFLRRTPYKEPEFTTINERRWYDYGIYLLEILIDAAPQRLSEADLDLIRRNHLGQPDPSNRNTLSSPVVSTGSDFLSAVQLRKSSTKRLSTSERVAKLARKSLFRSSRIK